MDNERSYGVRIKLIRDFYGWNQDKFAEKTGVSVPTVSRYETNATVPDLDFVKNLFFKLDVNPLWFFLDEGDVIIDTKFQLGDDFYELIKHIRSNAGVRMLFNQALELDPDEKFEEWHQIVGTIIQILRAEKEEAKRKREREQLERAEKSRARKK